MESKAIKHVSYILFFTFFLPVLGGQLLHTYLPYKFINLPVHSLFESIGGFIAVSLSGFLYYKTVHEPKLYPKYIWIIIALASMGVFDIFHAILAPGNNFVWLHSLAAFSGGFFFSLIWLSRLTHFNPPKSLLYIIIFITLLICLYSLLSPQNIPSMLNKDGTFSLTAEFLNLGGGVFFILATLFFMSEYTRNKDEQELLFVGHTLLFAIAGLLFNTSVLFDAGWWFWHVLRLNAYMFAQYFLIITFLHEVKAHKKAQEALKKYNIDLHDKIQRALTTQQAQQSLDAKYSKMNSLSAMISMVSNQWKHPIVNIKEILSRLLNKDKTSIELQELYHEIENMQEVINEFSQLHQLTKDKEKQSLRDALEAAIDIISPLIIKNTINIQTHYHSLSLSRDHTNALTQILLYLLHYLTQRPVNKNISDARINIDISECIRHKQTMIIHENFSLFNEDELYSQLVDNKNLLFLAQRLLKEQDYPAMQVQSTKTGFKFIIELEKNI